MQMFLWNNIFFSLGFDVKDHYKDFGGDYAALAAPVSCTTDCMNFVSVAFQIIGSHSVECCSSLYMVHL